MTRNRQIALFFLAAFMACSAATPVRAQDTTAPMVIKSKPTPEVKPLKERFEVLHMMFNAIQVRSLVNEREVRTFTYSDRIRDHMQALFNSGAYQYGDKVVIYYMARSDIALNIKGKPSKPI